LYYLLPVGLLWILCQPRKSVYRCEHSGQIPQGQPQR
jgi:hypothetical protein